MAKRLTRREARIARKIEAQLKDKEKSARLAVRPSDKPTVRLAEDPRQEKSVRTGADPGSIFSMQMVWTKDHADIVGTWSWGHDRAWTADCWKDNIEPSLLEWEKLTWMEIHKQTYGNEGRRRQSHHLMPVEECCTESQDRLTELHNEQEKRPTGQSLHTTINPYDTDELFRFRLGNLPRLWGIRIMNEFYVLWYDPEHNVYPIKD